MDHIEDLKKKLATVELKLDKCRTTTREDGWQTQRHAKKARNWDYYAKLKMDLISQIDECENSDDMCLKCNCWKHTRAMCS